MNLKISSNTDPTTYHAAKWPETTVSNRRAQWGLNVNVYDIGVCVFAPVTQLCVGAILRGVLRA